MKSFEFTVTSPVGIHARPALLLMQKASLYKSEITIEKGGKSANVKNIMSLMMLNVKKGDTVILSAEGEDEESAIAALEEFCINEL